MDETPAGVRARASDEERDRHEDLERIWAPPPGLVGFFTALNHSVIGLRFMVTAFVFFLLAGLLAVAMRVQVAAPLLGFLSPDAYNQAFTMHGSVMMFLFVIPFLEGLGIYLVPLMIGAREMPFPRLNAFGYWVFLFAGSALFVAWAAGYGPDSGWYNYPPLTGRGYRPGPNIDFWALLITFLEVSALVAAIELIVTILKFRAPGMSLNRMPVFVWAIFVTALMIVFAMPALVLASLMLELDRSVGTHFFNVAAGGDPLLWQHLFWFFGHPDVYIMLLPAVGAISMIVPAMVRRPLAGYTLVVAAIAIIGLLSFGVWVHHMYTVGLAPVGLNFFAAASMLFAVPSAIHILSWVFTIWRGRLERFTTAMLFAVAFIVLFILGGITGLMIGAVPFNWQVHDTQFIVAHFHYTMVGGVVFPFFAAIYFWFPKATGRLLDEGLGRMHFWLFLIGFNVTFLTMHVTGLEGMPRRVYTYLPGLGWELLNAISTLGTLVMALGVAFFLWNVVRSCRSGPPAAGNPWSATSLEWATRSPPASYNFLRVPIVRSLHPVGEAAEPPGTTRPRWLDRLTERPEGRRETVVSSVLTAEPEGKAILPGPSPWPLWAAGALGVAFLGAAWTPYLVPAGLLLAFATFVGWNLARPPGAEPRDAEPEGAAELSDRLTGLRSTVVWGTIVLVVIELTLVALLAVSWLYVRMGAEAWPPPGFEPPGLVWSLLAQAVLVASVVPLGLSLRWARAGQPRGAATLLGGALALGALHLVLLALELGRRGHRWDTHVWGSFDWTMTLWTGVHVALLLLVGGAVAASAARGRYAGGRHAPLQALVLYWVFVVVGSSLLQALRDLVGR